MFVSLCKDADTNINIDIDNLVMDLVDNLDVDNLDVDTIPDTGVISEIPITPTISERDELTNFCCKLYLNQAINNLNSNTSDCYVNFMDFFMNNDCKNEFISDSLDNKRSAMPNYPQLEYMENSKIIKILADLLKLNDQSHMTYIKNNLFGTSSNLLHYESSKPWLLYWMIHSINLLDATFFENESDEICQLKIDIVNFLNDLQNPSGGYGGGSSHLPHVVSTYAAVSALVSLQCRNALKSINRKTMYTFLLSIKETVTGSFRMHEDGESDIRATYCAISIASLLNILTPELIDKVPKYISSLQSFDGGISGNLYQESHGGYTYCGLATLFILNQVHVLNLENLLLWLVFRQQEDTGAFQGRPNKLSDSCYGFWCGASIALISQLENKHNEHLDLNHFLFDNVALKIYTLGCCQNENDHLSKSEGGLRDKPGAPSDLYHTCYSLSAMSICNVNKNVNNNNSLPISGLC